MLALAMAFLARPRLLMIDELSLGLAPVIVEQLLPIVRGIAEAGTTVIIVEQSVNVALTLADTAERSLDRRFGMHVDRDRADLDLVTLERGRQVEHDDLVTRVDQLAHQRAADAARSAKDRDASGHTSFLPRSDSR